MSPSTDREVGPGVDVSAVSDIASRPELEVSPQLYAWFHSHAKRKLRGRSIESVWQLTAVCNEVWQRLLVEQPGTKPEFLPSLLARFLDWTLADQGRHAMTIKHGGAPVSYDSSDEESAGPACGPLDSASGERWVDELIALLAERDPRAAEVAALKIHHRLSHPEVAVRLGWDQTEVRRHWTAARGWLLLRLGVA